MSDFVSKADCSDRILLTVLAVTRVVQVTAMSTVLKVIFCHIKTNLGEVHQTKATKVTMRQILMALRELYWSNDTKNKFQFNSGKFLASRLITKLSFRRGSL